MKNKKKTVSDRRRKKRFDCNDVLSVQPSNLGRVHMAKALNRGEAGIAFETDHELRVGAVVYIKKAFRLESNGGYVPRSFLPYSRFATIRWVIEKKSRGRSVYSAGAQILTCG